MNVNTLTDTLSSWGERVISLLPNALLALAVAVLSYALARFVRRYVRRIGHRISDNKAVSNLLALVIYIIIIIVGLTLSLQIMNLDGAATSILAGAGIAGVAIGFAFQDIAANFISGVVLAIQRPMKIGDLVETNSIFGIVKHINLRSTEVETLDGQYVHIPNKDILLNPMVDYSHKGTRRIDLDVGLAYDTDLDHAEKVTIATVKKLDNVQTDMPVDLYYTEFADSSINFTIRFWIKFSKQTDYLDIKSKAIKAIKKTYDKESISIPFPMRTLEIAASQAHLFKK